MKITDYQKAKGLRDEDVFLLDGEYGTKTIAAKELAKSLPDLLSSSERLEGLDLGTLKSIFYSEIDSSDFLFIAEKDKVKGVRFMTLGNIIWGGLNVASNVGIRNAICRGNSLGDHVTEEQWEEIRIGRFRNMWLDDYWDIGGDKYRIMHFNYWLESGPGSSKTVKPHVVLMPQSGMNDSEKVKMNDTATTSGGYVGSKMYHDSLDKFRTIIKNCFGESHILPVQRLLSNAVTNNKVTGVEWVRTDVGLPTIGMLSGLQDIAFGEMNNHVDTQQFANCRVNPRRIFQQNSGTWTCSVGNNIAYYVISGDGPNVGMTNANGIDCVVRPVFAIYQE